MEIYFNTLRGKKSDLEASAYSVNSKSSVVKSIKQEEGEKEIEERGKYMGRERGC